MIADNPNALQAARRKAFKLFTSIKTIFERRPEIKQIFESQDLKYSEVGIFGDFFMTDATTINSGTYYRTGTGQTWKSVFQMIRQLC